MRYPARLWPEPPGGNDGSIEGGCERKLRGQQRDRAALSHSLQGQAMAATNAGFLKNVLEMDFDGAGTNAELLRDFAIFKALFDQFHHLMLARRQFRANLGVEIEHVAKDGILHPAPALRRGPQAGQDGLRIRGFANDAFGSRLKKA